MTDQVPVSEQPLVLLRTTRHKRLALVRANSGALKKCNLFTLLNK